MSGCASLKPTCRPTQTRATREPSFAGRAQGCLRQSSEAVHTHPTDSTACVSRVACHEKSKVTLVAFVWVSNAPSNCKPKWMQSCTHYIFYSSSLCVVKCMLKPSARVNAQSHELQLFYFSPLCVLKCCLKWFALHEVLSQMLHYYTLKRFLSGMWRCGILCALAKHCHIFTTPNTVKMC